MEVVEYHDQTDIQDHHAQEEPDFRTADVVPVSDKQDVATGTESKEPAEIKKETTEDAKAEAKEDMREEKEEVKEAPKPKKRLTLQERLALAAKSGNKKVEKKTASDASPRVSIDSSRPSLEEEAPKDTVVAEEPSGLDIPSSFDDLPKEDVIALVTKLNEAYTKMKSDTDTQVVQLNSQISSLQSKISTLNSVNESIQSKLKSNTKTQDNSLISRKLEDKEKQIKELLEEGAKLSSKEVSLTQTIKKLRAKEQEDGDEIERLKEENEHLVNKLNSLQTQLDSIRDSEKSIKEERLNFELLQQKFDKLSKDRTNIYNELKELKHKRLDVQLANTKKQLDEEAKRCAELKQQQEQVSLQFEMFKDQSKVEVSQLEIKLEKEKQRYNNLKDENYHEIKRLETKMEELRIQSENKLVGSGDSNHEIDRKLVSTNEILQIQYTQALENWKLIESSYQNKISQFENDINMLKQKDMNYSRKIKTLTSDLRAKVEENEELQEVEASLKEEIEKLKQELISKEEDIKSLQHSYDVLSKQLDADKQKFEEEKAKLKEEAAQAVSVVPAPIQPQSLYLNDLSSLNLFKSQRSVSGISQMNHNWDIALGESSTTPRSTLPNSRKVSHTSLYMSPSIQTPIYNRYEFAEHDDDFDVSSPISTYKKDDDDLGSSSNNLTAHGSTGGANIQLIGKLSSQIRRLEVEMISLKDEISTLSREKSEATTEILRLMKENEELSKLGQTNAELEAELGELSKNYETTLVLLGEKSEQVEELKADVHDLKDLCREQVNQLVALQSKT